MPPPSCCSHGGLLVWVEIRVCYTQQGVLGLTVPAYWALNPAYAQVQSEHVWSTAWFDILNAGMSPEAAADKAFKRITDIFSKYPIVQS
jgi:ABC-type glycerol-3-phosphate transport system substrate-binding protein